MGTVVNETTAFVIKHPDKTSTRISNVINGVDAETILAAADSLNSLQAIGKSMQELRRVYKCDIEI